MEIDELEGWRRSHYTVEITPEIDGKEVLVMGWVRDIRDLGGIRFIVLQDRLGKVQITVPESDVDEKTLSKSGSLHRQDCVAVRGIVRKMEKAPRGVEIIPKEIKILGIAKQPLPLDVTGKTPAEIDVRLDARVLDLRSDRGQAVFKIRHTVLEDTRSFLSRKGFLEINTPKIIASATEGGAALFPIVYFEREAFLAQSPQLYKEELIIDFEKVFEIGPAYRAEKSHTRRHITEFISIDIEEAFATAEDVMKVAEELMYHVCKTVREKCGEELRTLGHKVDLPQLPLKRLTYNEVIEELQKKDVKIEWGEDIPTVAFRTLGKIHPYFYFITNWPTRLKPFYIKPRDDDPEISEGFDLMWSWIEIASGGTRVHKKGVVIERLKEQGLHPESFKYHLQAFDYGMPPHAGWAIGLERLIMMLTGIKNIREVVLFPRDRFRLTP
ncbi:TPA: aspartate--tRNA(Asn) ligase [Candidatus Bathyarchaeota archaeon]|nr:aspartate--tRNA(Asn) ligase [Candidatus Bathyarchaeota archaeon]